MRPRYRLTVFTEFAAAHSLRGYPGECSRVHGHNWRVEVEVESTALNGLGMAMDFKTVKQAARTVAAELDHRNLNDIKPFDEVNPTAENIAAYFHRGLSGMLNNGAVRVASVTIWETDTAGVRYSEEDDS